MFYKYATQSTQAPVYLTCCAYAVPIGLWWPNSETRNHFSCSIFVSHVRLKSEVKDVSHPIILSRCKALESTSFVAWRVVTSLHWERDKGSCSDVRELFLISFSHSLRQNVTKNTKIVWKCCNEDSQLDPVEWCLYTMHRCFWQAKVKSISPTTAGEMSNTQTWSFLDSNHHDINSLRWIGVCDKILFRNEQCNQYQPRNVYRLWWKHNKKRHP